MKPVKTSAIRTAAPAVVLLLIVPASVQALVDTDRPVTGASHWALQAYRNPGTTVDRNAEVLMDLASPGLREAVFQGNVQTAEYFWETLRSGDAWGLDDRERNPFIADASRMLADLERCLGCETAGRAEELRQLAVATLVDRVVADCLNPWQNDPGHCRTAAGVKLFNEVVERYGRSASFSKATAMALSGNNRVTNELVGSVLADLGINAKKDLDGAAIYFWSMATQVLRLLDVTVNLYRAQSGTVDPRCEGDPHGEFLLPGCSFGGNGDSNNDCYAPRLEPVDLRVKRIEGYTTYDHAVLLQHARTSYLNWCGKYGWGLADWAMDLTVVGKNLVGSGGYSLLDVAIGNSHFDQLSGAKYYSRNCPDTLVTARCNYELINVDVRLVDYHNFFAFLFKRQVYQSAPRSPPPTNGYFGPGGLGTRALDAGITYWCESLATKASWLSYAVSAACYYGTSYYVIQPLTTQYKVQSEGIWGERNAVGPTILQVPDLRGATQATFAFDPGPRPTAGRCHSDAGVCPLYIQYGGLYLFQWPLEVDVNQHHWAKHAYQTVSVKIAVSGVAG